MKPNALATGWEPPFDLGNELDLGNGLTNLD
jgi:hypothetical protein